MTFGVDHWDSEIEGDVMSYRAHNRILLSASLFVIVVSFTITITQGAENILPLKISADTCQEKNQQINRAENQPSSTILSDRACSTNLSTPEFLTILFFGVGLTGVGFAVRRLSNGTELR